jgi:hypothetical protein
LLRSIRRVISRHNGRRCDLVKAINCHVCTALQTMNLR